MEAEMNNLPLLGEKLPEMTVQTTDGKKKLPEDYKGKWLVLFSHPGDFTPVCTTEFMAFAQRKEKFDELNTELLGHSVDQVHSHIKWIKWIEETMEVKIPFPIIADERGKIAERLGMIHPNKGSNSVRAVFIIDAEGRVRTILYYPQEIGRNMEEILRAVEALQTSDANGVAMPANWPNNDFMKDRVIIPPASTMEAANKREKEYECYDWWFCHKEL